ncbi:hypothetical protein [Clostridium sp. UBA2485]|uniref:hypothetical protein n=1 Tax=Clostridium sp. UBA2485 TaxID=1946352 RepID=UPI0025BAFF8E|nr:hypothetical protein [Clostridium sp. UBA2485]
MDKYKKLKEKLNKDYKEIAVHIVKDYAKYGSYGKLVSVYGTSRENLSRLVRTHISYIERHYPELYKRFNEQYNETSKARYMEMQQRSSEAREKKSKDCLLHFSNRNFKELPKTIEYRSFLDWCCQYDTKDLRGIELVSMAERNGITIIG